MKQIRVCPVCRGESFCKWGNLRKCETCCNAFHESELSPPRAARTSKPATRIIAGKQEKKNAKDLGGRTTIASGSTPMDKADVKGEDFRAECVLPGTPILIGFGEYKAIEDLRVGDMVVTHTGARRPVTGVSCRDYAGPLALITPTGDPREIGMTPEHPVMTGTESWCPAGQLSYTAYVYLPVIQKTPCLITQPTRAPYAKKPPLPRVENTEALALFLGYYTAEGGAYDHRRHIKLVFSEKETHFIDEVERLLLHIFREPAHIRHIPAGGTLVITVCHKTLANSLAEWCGQGSRKKHLPRFIAHSDALLRSYLLGISASISRGKKNPTKGGYIAQVRVFGQDMDLFAEKIGFGKRKQTSAGNKRSFSDGKGIWARHRRKMIEYSGPVHNLEVDIDHSYVCGSVTVHNCKYTEKASYVLKRAALDLIKSQAKGDQMPLFSIEFQNPGQAHAEWFIVPKEWFLEMLEAHRQVKRVG